MSQGSHLMLACQAVDLWHCSWLVLPCKVLEASELQEAYIPNAAKPDQPESVRQQLQAAWNIIR